MVVKKISKLPDGGGWKAHGRKTGSTGTKKRARFGYDYVHPLFDDPSRLAYCEILPDEIGTTCGRHFCRAPTATSPTTASTARTRHTGISAG